MSYRPAIVIEIMHMNMFRRGDPPPPARGDFSRTGASRARAANLAVHTGNEPRRTDPAVAIDLLQNAAGKAGRASVSIRIGDAHADQVLTRV